MSKSSKKITKTIGLVVFVDQLIEGWKGEGEFDCTVIRFVSTTAKKFGTCTVMSVNGTLVEDAIRRFQGKCAHFNINKCPIYTHRDATAKFNTNSRETDNSVGWDHLFM